ncbi:MAG: hypothetical protein OXC60_05460 [Litoreibacter sp.]|nr:hypothetical protein [Litoreibacter sp.]MCY4334103.1 hypothetical protein [Litoreibacter sp.]
MGSERDAEAWRIATYMVERTRSSIFEGDFETFADSFTYPHTSTTEEKTIVIKDMEDMRRLFDNVRASHRQMGMTHLSRETIAAEFKDEDTLIVVHVNHMMAGTRRINAPFPVYSTLKRFGDTWRIEKAEYAIDKKLPFGAALEKGQIRKPLGSKEDAKD